MAVSDLHRRELEGIRVVTRRRLRQAVIARINPTSRYEGRTTRPRQTMATSEQTPRKA